MIIPIRCFTCGKVLASKWKKFSEKKKQQDDSGKDNGLFEGSYGEIFNEIGITKICCKRHFLGHVDMIDVI